MVDSYLQVEAYNLEIECQQQPQLRSDGFSGLVNHFKGSPKNMQKRYDDAMSIVGDIGNPDIFVTFTCNPDWIEIKDNIFPGQSAADRPDLVARVFKLKLEELMRYIQASNTFGIQILGWFYTIEFQKKGLPHAHIFFITHPDDKFKTPEAINGVVSAEIPDEVTSPKLFEIVTRQMIHRPSGIKKFPKRFTDTTSLSSDGYPCYKRSKKSPVNVRGKLVDNSFVVPYNSKLLLMFDAHINVEICTTVSAVKDKIKYIYKGYDSTSLRVFDESLPDNNKIENSVDTRYVRAIEAAWHLFEFKMHDNSHTVERLKIHLPDSQQVYFKKGRERDALNRAVDKMTDLTAYFQLNCDDRHARAFLYSEIPKHYVLQKEEGNSKWVKRQNSRDEKVITRIYNVFPKDIEKFCLRLLLLHVRGATSFESLRTVKAVIYPTFKDAARQLNLLTDDPEWQSCLEEAAHLEMPKQMRVTFAYILVFCSPTNALELWNEFKNRLSEDFAQRFPLADSERAALHEIDSVLQRNNLTVQKFNLPDPGPAVIANTPQFDIAVEAENASALIATLNHCQRIAFDAVVKAMNSENPSNTLFYIDGPGGSGKTYLYKTLMAYVRGQGELVLPHATTGIAATLLIGGRTMHSGFGIPIQIYNNSTSYILMTSIEAQNLRNAKLLIIDEASMMTTHALGCIDRLLKEVMQNDRPFGGKILVLGGDFRQILPIVKPGSRTNIVKNCLKSSKLWSQFTVFKLIDNMRSPGQAEFNQWLIDIGEGRNLQQTDYIEIPLHMVERESITRAIFGDLSNVDELAKQVILTPKNGDVFRINNEVLTLLPGVSRTYESFDKAVTDNSEVKKNYTQELLNAETHSELPPHLLTLKVGYLLNQLIIFTNILQYV